MSIRAALFILCLAVLGCSAHAAESDLYWLGGTSSTGAPIWIPVSSANPLPVTGGGGGSGCTPSGGNAVTNLVLYGTAGACAADTLANATNGALTLGISGTAGSVTMSNATSGAVTLQPVAGALGTVTASLPANTGIIAEINLAQTWSAVQTFSSGLTFTGLSAGTQVSCLGLDSGNNVVLLASACGSGGGTPANPTATAGPTAVNGVATTYMRSDAAPAVQKASSSQFGIVEVDNQTIVSTAGVISTSAPDVTKIANYSVAATDMGGQINCNGSGITITIPAISSTILAANMSVAINNIGTVACTLSTTPTINGFLGTSIPPYGGLNCISNGTSLDCIGLGMLASYVGAVNTQSGTTYTLTAADCGKTVVSTNASAITFTTFQAAVVGCNIVVEQGGAGQITFANGGSATLVSAHSFTKTFNAKGATVNLFVDVNAGTAAEFILSGDGA